MKQRIGVLLASICLLPCIAMAQSSDELKKQSEEFRRQAIKEYRGKGLMIGMELNDEYVGLRDRLLFERHFFTGAAGANVIRLLPSLTVSQETAGSFVNAWKELTL